MILAPYIDSHVMTHVNSRIIVFELFKSLGYNFTSSSEKKSGQFYCRKLLLRKLGIKCHRKWKFKYYIISSKVVQCDIKLIVTNFYISILIHYYHINHYHHYYCYYIVIVVIIVVVIFIVIAFNFYAMKHYEY